jgi:hypothetical protein
MTTPTKSLTRPIALKLAGAADRNDTAKLIKILSQFNLEDRPRTWGAEAKTLINWLKDTTQSTPYSIFVKGNSKLPFYAFSNLPLVNCPGKGSCAKWCYSLKAWRTPGGLFRQIQNTILVRERSKLLSDAFKAIPNNSDVRLYVDGDIDSLSTMIFWFDLLNKRQDLKVYGYSKSWKLFVQYYEMGGKFPTNYSLNLSSGSKYENRQDIVDVMNSLPITRGQFIAVNAGKKPTSKQVRIQAIKQGIKNVFVCPGKCGECLSTKKSKNTHACGALDLFKNVNIVIGTH